MKFFTKTKKAIISLVLCVLMIMPLGISALGISESAGLPALRGLFRRSQGETIPGLLEGRMFYSWSTPIEEDPHSTDKFPLVIFIGETIFSDKYSPYNELKETSFPMWASEEYQKRFFDSEGAYLMFMALPAVAYARPAMAASTIMKTIKGFVAENQTNIDTDRVYMVSWGNGCKLAANVVGNNYDYFSAIVMMSPTAVFETSEINAISGIPTWLFACRADEAANFSQCGEQNWDAIRGGTTDLYTIRYTTFDSFNTTGIGVRGHLTWEFAAYDMHYKGEYQGMKTINGKGTSISFDGDEGMISWLSKQGSDYGSDCDCQCHTATGFAKFLWMLKMLISMMIKYEPNRVCKCGKAHY